MGIAGYPGAAYPGGFYPAATAVLPAGGGPGAPAVFRPLEVDLAPGTTIDLVDRSRSATLETVSSAVALVANDLRAAAQTSGLAANLSDIESLASVANPELGVAGELAKIDLDLTPGGEVGVVELTTTATLAKNTTDAALQDDEPEIALEETTTTLETK